MPPYVHDWKAFIPFEPLIIDHLEEPSSSFPIHPPALRMHLLIAWKRKSSALKRNQRLSFNRYGLGSASRGVSPPALDNSRSLGELPLTRGPNRQCDRSKQKDFPTTDACRSHPLLTLKGANREAKTTQARKIWIWFVCLCAGCWVGVWMWVCLRVGWSEKESKRSKGVFAALGSFWVMEWTVGPAEELKSDFF